MKSEKSKNEIRKMEDAIAEYVDHTIHANPKLALNIVEHGVYSAMADVREQVMTRMQQDLDIPDDLMPEAVKYVCVIFRARAVVAKLNSRIACVSINGFEDGLINGLSSDNE